MNSIENNKIFPIYLSGDGKFFHSIQELKKYIINEKQILNKNIVETIKNDDYMTFKKYVPECNQNYFTEMKNELK